MSGWEDIDQRPKVKSDNERCEYPTRCKCLEDGYMYVDCTKFKKRFQMDGMFCFDPHAKCITKDCKELP